MMQPKDASPDAPAQTDNARNSRHLEDQFKNDLVALIPQAGPGYEPVREPRL